MAAVVDVNKHNSGSKSENEFGNNYGKQLRKKCTTSHKEKLLNLSI